MIPLTRQLASLLLVLGICVPTTAAAQAEKPSAADIATARDLFRQGARLAQEEKWEAALDAYQRSMTLRPSNLTRYSIAIVQERMGKLVEAMENLRVFLTEDHDRSTLRYVHSAKQQVRDIEQRVARIKVMIPGEPRGAQVRIDGEAIPEASIGVYRPTDPGKRRVEARVPGYPPFVQIVELEEGQEVEIAVKLGARGTPEAEAGAFPPGEDQEQPRSDATPGIVLTAAGAGVFTIGLGVGVYGYAKAKDADTTEGADADSARTMSLIGDIGMGVGLVAAGVGTYLLLSGADSKTETSAIFLQPWAAQRSAGIAAGGKF